MRERERRREKYSREREKIMGENDKVVQAPCDPPYTYICTPQKLYICPSLCTTIRSVSSRVMLVWQELWWWTQHSPLRARTSPAWRGRTFFLKTPHTYLALSLYDAYDHDVIEPASTWIASSQRPLFDKLSPLLHHRMMTLTSHIAIEKKKKNSQYRSYAWPSIFRHVS